MIKKLIALLTVMLFLTVRVSALNSGDISAECAVLITEQTGEILFSKNSNTRHSMASTTKIMTSLLAVESGRLNDEIVVNDNMVNVEGTSMGLVSGDRVSLEELVYGMMLASGNDAANTVAVHLGGNVENFAKIMNNRAKQIGMFNSNFVTPSGLDDNNHYSTAYDMALLGRMAVKNPKFLRICSSKKESLNFGNPPYLRTLYNHNRLLKCYDGALGIKTGFTKKSGRCLVSYAKRNGVGLVAVTLNDRNDWHDHIQMFDYGFSCVKQDKLNFSCPKAVNVVGGKDSFVNVSCEDYKFSTACGKQLQSKIIIKKFLYAPIKVGEIVGKVDIYCDGKLIDSLSIVTTQNVDMQIINNKNKDFLSKFKERFIND